MTKKIFPINSVPQSKTAGLYSYLTAVEGTGAGLRFRSQPDDLDPPAKCFVPPLDSFESLLNSFKYLRDVFESPLDSFKYLLDSFKPLLNCFKYLLDGFESPLVHFKIGSKCKTFMTLR